MCNLNHYSQKVDLKKKQTKILMIDCSWLQKKMKVCSSFCQAECQKNTASQLCPLVQTCFSFISFHIRRVEILLTPTPPSSIIHLMEHWNCVSATNQILYKTWCATIAFLLPCLVVFAFLFGCIALSSYLLFVRCCHLMTLKTWHFASHLETFGAICFRSVKFSILFI